MSNTAKTSKSIKEWESMISAEVPFIGLKPYSHNIIGLCLLGVSNEHGKDEANRIIKKFKLDKKGWSVEP